MTDVGTGPQGASCVCACVGAAAGVPAELPGAPCVCWGDGGRGGGHIPGAGSSRGTSAGTAPRPRRLRSARAGHLLASPNVPLGAGRRPRLVSWPSCRRQTSVTSRAGSEPFPTVRFSSPLLSLRHGVRWGPRPLADGRRSRPGVPQPVCVSRAGTGQHGSRTPVFHPTPICSWGYLWIRQLAARAQMTVPKTTSI